MESLKNGLYKKEPIKGPIRKTNKKTSVPIATTEKCDNEGKKGNFKFKN